MSPFALLLVAMAFVVPEVNGLTVTFGFGSTTSLSGSLTACRPNATVATCTGGLAALDAFGRNLTKTNTTDHLVLIPEIDVSTPFVQMHPSGFSINLDIYDHLGIDTYTIKPSLLSSRSASNYSRLFREDVSPILTNSDIPSSDEWFAYVKNRYIFTVEGVRIGFLYITPSQQQFSTSAVPALTVAIKSLRRDADFVVVLYQDREVTGASAIAQLGDNLPDILLDIGSKTANTAIGQVANTTLSRWLGTVQIDGYGVFLTATLDANNQVTKVGLDRVTLTTLPTSLKDQQYYDFQTYLLGLSTAASTNDPILSHTTVAVAPSRVAGSYPCFAGECAQGTITARALSWYFETDIGFLNSGGPRGPGWPAGPVKTSDVWAFNTFSNTPCVGTILGLKVWELVNTSLSFCTFSSAYNLLGDRFMQTFGLQIDYDNSSLSVAAGTRVRAIRIRDKTTGLYAPLERLKYYTFASDSYQCTGMPEISPILIRRYTGETMNTAYSDELLQLPTQQFLIAHDPYTPVFQNYLTSTPAIEVSDFMVWSQSLKTCDAFSHWNAGLGTCITCPTGQQRDGSDATACAPIPSVPEESKTVVNVVVPIIVVLGVGLIGAVVFVWWHSGKNVRNTKFAPKGDTATIIFTDIQMSTKLWGTVPASMGLALDQHHAMIREAIRAHDAYEVKTVGDSFMIAVDSPQRAVDLSLQIQTDFMAAKWPRCIDLAYAAESMPEVLEDIDDNPDDVTNEGIDMQRSPNQPGSFKQNQPGSFFASGSPDGDKKPAPHISKDFHGVRVRIGIHSGPVDAIFDEIAKGYDYYGNTVNLAARIESSADGGQVVMSRTVANNIQMNDSVFKVELLGEAELRGVIGATELLQILPVSLTQRIFTAKAIDKIQDNDDKGSNSSKVSVAISVNGLPMLSDRDATIKDYFGRAFKPLKPDARQKQLEILAKAWHVRFPKKMTDTEKQEMVLSVISQRIGAAVPQPARRPLSFRVGESTGNSVRYLVDGAHGHSGIHSQNHNVTILEDM